MGLIEQEWQSFASRLLEKAPDIQRREMRRAFYAGAWAFLQRTGKELSNEDEMTPADESLMEGIAAEFEAFLDDVKAGRA